MKRCDLICVAVLVSVVVVAVVAACGGGQGPAAGTPASETTPAAVVTPGRDTPTGEMTPTAAVSPAPAAELGGEELLQARCSRCHTLERVQVAAKVQAEWEATVERMRGKGAELTDAEAQILVEYLAQTFAP
ncbi:MAG: hypothetical protein MUP62_03460 [Dehalococcoidia bacterium]|nr:hypothetical protein [Dehalococcoidia bacterium]